MWMQAGEWSGDDDITTKEGHASSRASQVWKIQNIYGKYTPYPTRQAGKNKQQTEDSEEDENVKRRLRSTSASAGQVWR